MPRKPKRKRQKASGFTFGHNLIESGYPIIEAIRAVAPSVREIVYVDMESTDNTNAVLMELCHQSDIPICVIQGKWEPTGDKCLAENYALHSECEYDTIFHFEADEVFDWSLCLEIDTCLAEGVEDIAVWRIQVGENWQRIRWYPHLVHRIFQKGAHKGGFEIGGGHTTIEHFGGERNILALEPSAGFLWDCSTSHRDNFITRAKNQAWWWGHEPIYRVVSEHFTTVYRGIHDEAAAREYLKEPHWTFPESPFFLPDELLKLVGHIKYVPFMGDDER